MARKKAHTPEEIVAKLRQAEMLVGQGKMVADAVRVRDTVIQRWRDPVDGSVCHRNIPISAPLLPPAQNGGFAQYGPNTIGSISCSHPTQVVQLVAATPAPQAPPPSPQPARDSRPRR